MRSFGLLSNEIILVIFYVVFVLFVDGKKAKYHRHGHAHEHHYENDVKNADVQNGGQIFKLKGVDVVAKKDDAKRNETRNGVVEDARRAEKNGSKELDGNADEKNKSRERENRTDVGVASKEKKLPKEEGRNKHRGRGKNAEEERAKKTKRPEEEKGRGEREHAKKKKVPEAEAEKNKERGAKRKKPSDADEEKNKHRRKDKKPTNAEDEKNKRRTKEKKDEKNKSRRTDKKPTDAAGEKNKQPKKEKKPIDAEHEKNKSRRKGKKPSEPESKSNGKKSTRRQNGVRIIGGSETSVEKHPYIVSIHKMGDNGMKHSCGGSVINRRLVMTAGHCCVDYKSDRPYPSSWYRVHAGTTNSRWFKGGSHSSVDRVLPHPHYNRKRNVNDMCLLVLKDLLHYSKTVQPVALPNPNMFGTREPSTYYKDSMCVTAGWGHTSPNSSSVEILRSVELPLISYEECTKKLRVLYRRLNNVELCTMSKLEKDACQGDSGGPLMCNDVQVGITSWGVGCGDYDHPGVWARVDLYVDWINKMKMSYSERTALPTTSRSLPSEFVEDFFLNYKKENARTSKPDTHKFGHVTSGQNDIVLKFVIVKILLITYL